MRGGRRVAAVVISAVGLGLALGGCGGDFAEAPACRVSIAVSPSVPVAPVTLVAAAQVSRADLPGAIVLVWTATGPDGSELVPTPRDPELLQVEIAAPTPGDYTLTASARVGSITCDGDRVVVPVAPPQVELHELHLRYAPPLASEVPPQADPDPVFVRREVDQSLPERTLDGGRVLGGVLFGPGGVLAGQLRLTRPGLAGELVGTAGDDGAYALRVTGAGPWTVEVTPYDMAVAPERRSEVDGATLDMSLTLAAGELVEGTVVDGDGVAVAGATVSAWSGQLAATLATTDALGRFSLRARAAAGPLELRVTPLEEGVPEATLAASAGLAAGGGALAVALGDTEQVLLSLEVHRANDELLGGAEVQLTAVDAAAASVTQAGGAAAVMTARWSKRVVADGSGRVSVLVPRGTLRVSVRPPRGNEGDDRLAEVTLVAAGAPQVERVATRAAVPLVVLATTPGGTPRSGATVTVRWRSPGEAVDDVVRGVADAAGQVAFALPEREVTIDVTAPPGATLAAGRRVVTVGAAPQVEVALRYGRRISGVVRAPSGGVFAGVGVTAECVTCVEPTITSTVTGPSGAWSMVVEEP